MNITPSFISTDIYPSFSIFFKVEDRLAAAKRNLSIKQEQGELFGGDGSGVKKSGMDNNETLDAAEQVHDQIEDSLVSERSLSLIVYIYSC